MNRTNQHRRARRVSKRRALTFRGAGDVRGFAGLGDVPPMAWALGALAGLAFILTRRTTVSVVGKVVDAAKQGAFALALPSAVRPWAGHILSAASRYGVDPWMLAGLMYQESGGGTQLTPPGPEGTGDFIKRPAGRKYVQPSGKLYAVGPSGMPEDGLGWGRGLMQIDFGVHYEWFQTGVNWRDPQVNIDKGAALLRERLSFFRATPTKPVSIETWRLDRGMPEYGIQPWRVRYPSASFPTYQPGTKLAGSYRDPRPLSGEKLTEAVLASFNAGYAGPLQALALGLPTEAATTGQNYVSKFLSRVAVWSAKMQG